MLRHHPCFVLAVVVGLYASFLVDAGVEESHDQVGVFPFLDDGDPVLGRGHHVVEVHARPEVAGHPVGDGGREQSEEGYAHALALYNIIRCEVGLARRLPDDVGSEHGEAALADPSVVHGVPGLDVVVAYHGYVVGHAVHGLGYDVRGEGIYEVVVVGCGVTLEHVAAIGEDDCAGHFRAALCHVLPQPGQGVEHVAVDIAGVEDAQVQVFGGLGGAGGEVQGHGDCSQGCEELRVS